MVLLYKDPEGKTMFDQTNTGIPDNTSQMPNLATSTQHDENIEIINCLEKELTKVTSAYKCGIIAPAATLCVN